MAEQMEAGSYANSRKRLIWGEVHDGNAYFLGGAAGNAGLFSSVFDALVLAQQFIGETSQLLRPDTCELFRTNMTPGLEEARTIGWQLAATNESTAGTDLHLIVLATTDLPAPSCWIDAGNERVYLLFTNRTHNRVLPFANINAVRRQFHSIAAHALE